MDRKQAWSLLRDVRRSIYALESLELDEEKMIDIRDQAARLDRLANIEELAEKASELTSRDRNEIKEAISLLRRGTQLTEDRQINLVALLKKVGGKLWDVARPVLSEILTATVKHQLNLDVG